MSNELVTGEDRQRPDGDGTFTTPAARAAHHDRPVAVTGPWPAGTSGGWWSADTAAPAATVAPPPASTPAPAWREAPATTSGTIDEPVDRDLAERPTDELTAVIEAPAASPPAPPASSSSEHPTEELPGSSTDDTVLIWRPTSDDDAAVTQRLWVGRTRGRHRTGATASRPRKPPKPPRQPAAGLLSIVVLSLLAAFFSWVSAEPLWLAFGQGETGTATVTRCTGSGVQQHCVGTFTAEDGAFTSEHVRLLGVEDEHRADGTQLQALMVDSHADTAYVDSGTQLLHLRWAIGLGLVLLCGLGLVWGTGALRLTDRRARWTATLTALGAPMLLALGFLAAVAI